jgi:hypothetical protein
LEKDLPFAAKQKSLPKKESQLDRPVLIGYKNKQEKQVDLILQQLGTIKNDKVQKAREKKKESLAKREKELKVQQDQLDRRAKDSRKRVFRLQGIEEERAAKKRKFGNSKDQD